MNHPNIDLPASKPLAAAPVAAPAVAEGAELVELDVLDAPVLSAAADVDEVKLSLVSVADVAVVVSIVNVILTPSISVPVEVALSIIPVLPAPPAIGPIIETAPKHTAPPERVVPGRKLTECVRPIPVAAGSEALRAAMVLVSTGRVCIAEVMEVGEPEEG